MSVGLKLRLSLSVMSTLYCLPLLYPQITLTYIAVTFFQKVLILVQRAPNLGRLKEDLEKKIKIFKLIVEILKAFPVLIRIRLQTNCSIFLESTYSVHAVHSSPLQRL